jgi:hypothetical protein
MANQKLGIIQSRGLGDIIIALPIAKHYADLGWEVLWPITAPWVEQMAHYAPWVKWIPVDVDYGPFFYDVPLQRLKNFKCDEIICLYNALTGHPEFSNEPFFQFTTFDQYKYVQAGVPFLKKWTLDQCITRDPVREQALYDRKIKNPNYVVTHLKSSQFTVKFDASIIPADWDIIEISDEGYIFDWIKIIEGAQSIVMTNSVFANMTDQLKLGDDKYFIPLHHLNWSPTWGTVWNWLPNPDLPDHHRTVGAPG